MVYHIIQKSYHSPFLYHTKESLEYIGGVVLAMESREHLSSDKERCCFGG